MSLLSVTQKINRLRTERCDVITLLQSDPSVTINACAYLLTIPARRKTKREEGERERETEIRQEVPAINSTHSCDLSCSSTMCIT